jgi:hypothetical protein
VTAGRLTGADDRPGQALIACGAGATITEVEIPRNGAEAIQPYRIIAGPDGNLWVTEVWANSIARLSGRTARSGSPSRSSTPSDASPSGDVGRPRPGVRTLLGDGVLGGLLPGQLR